MLVSFWQRPGGAKAPLARASAAIRLRGPPGAAWRPPAPALAAAVAAPSSDGDGGFNEKPPLSVRSKPMEQLTWRGSESERKAFAGAFNVSFIQPLVAMDTTAEAVQRLHDLVQQLPGVTVSQVHKAGRGTNVPNSSDVDLIFFVHEMDGRALSLGDWHDRGVGIELRRRVRTALEARALDWDVQISEKAHYRYAMQLTLGKMPVEVDLLLLPDVVEGRYDWMSRQHEALMVPVYGNPGGARHSVLRGRADSVAFTQFVREQPFSPRLVTRALKAWRDGLDVSTVPNCGIGSVALEVLALAAHQQLRWQQKWQGYSRKDSPKVYQARLFQAALSLLVEAVEEGRVVTVDAGTWGSPRSALDYQHCWAADPVKIIHPIDPTCNLAHQRPDKPTAQWQAVAAEAKELLDTFRTGTLGEVLGRLGPAMQLQWDRERAAWDRRLRLVLTSPDGWGTTAFRR